MPRGRVVHMSMSLIDIGFVILFFFRPNDFLNCFVDLRHKKCGPMAFAQVGDTTTPKDDLSPPSPPTPAASQPAEWVVPYNVGAVPVYETLSAPVAVRDAVLFRLTKEWFFHGCDFTLAAAHPASLAACDGSVRRRQRGSGRCV
jgi:hypothetical protein